MDDFFKLESYLELIKLLKGIKSFYTSNYGQPDLFGHVSYSMPQLNKINVSKVFSDLEKLEITTSEKTHSSYVEICAEVRHKILFIIASIPMGNIARDIYLRNYEIYFKHCESSTDNPELLFDIIYYPETMETEMKSKHDQLISWSSGAPIPFVEINERILNSICKYFHSERRYINSSCIYYGYSDIDYILNVDFNKLGNTLANLKWINSDQVRAFKVLYSGKSHYEPLQWNGGLSDLNKFIQAMYTKANKESKSPNFEWTKFSSFTLVNNEFPAPKNLKGAFTPADNTIQSFNPFGTIIKDSHFKNLPT